MKRYLVIADRFARGCSPALAVCNDSAPWMDEVIGESDPRVADWFRRARAEAPPLPLIIRIEDDDTVHVVSGEMFQWRVFHVLGPDGARRLRRMITEETHSPDPERESDRSEGHRPLPRAPQPVDRRSFMGLKRREDA